MVAEYPESRWGWLLWYLGSPISTTCPLWRPSYSNQNRTPSPLHAIQSAKMAPNVPPDCWRCSHSRSDFTYIFRSCPAIVPYWEAVVRVVKQVSGNYFPPSLRVCLLGLVDQLAPTVAERTLLGLLLFYSRKTRNLTWKKSTPPAVFSVDERGRLCNIAL